MTERERVACAIAETKATRAFTLLEEIERELDASGLYGIAGVAHEAAQKTKRLIARANGALAL
jgi:ribosomal protein L22